MNSGLKHLLVGAGLGGLAGGAGGYLVGEDAKAIGAGSLVGALAGSGIGALKRVKGIKARNSVLDEILSKGTKTRSDDLGEAVYEVGSRGSGSDDYREYLYGNLDMPLRPEFGSPWRHTFPSQKGPDIGKGVPYIRYNPLENTTYIGAHTSHGRVEPRRIRESIGMRLPGDSRELAETRLDIGELNRILDKVDEAYRSNPLFGLAKDPPEKMREFLPEISGEKLFGGEGSEMMDASPDLSKFRETFFSPGEIKIPLPFEVGGRLYPGDTYSLQDLQKTGSEKMNPFLVGQAMADQAKTGHKKEAILQTMLGRAALGAGVGGAGGALVSDPHNRGAGALWGALGGAGLGAASIPGQKLVGDFMKKAPKPTAGAPKPPAGAPKPRAEAPVDSSGWPDLPPAGAPKPPAAAPKPTADAPKPTADAPKPTADAPKPTADAPNQSASYLDQFKDDAGLNMVSSTKPVSSKKPVRRMTKTRRSELAKGRKAPQVPAEQPALKSWTDLAKEIDAPKKTPQPDVFNPYTKKVPAAQSALASTPASAPPLTGEQLFEGKNDYVKSLVTPAPATPLTGPLTGEQLFAGKEDYVKSFIRS